MRATRESVIPPLMSTTHNQARPGKDGEGLLPTNDEVSAWIAALRSGEYTQGSALAIDPLRTLCQENKAMLSKRVKAGHSDPSA